MNHMYRFPVHLLVIALGTAFLSQRVEAVIVADHFTVNDTGSDQELENPTPSASATPEPTPTPAPTVSPTPSPEATPSPSASPSPQPSPSISPSPTPSPSVSPSPSPSPQPTPKPTNVGGVVEKDHEDPPQKDDNEKQERDDKEDDKSKNQAEVVVDEELEVPRQDSEDEPEDREIYPPASATERFSTLLRPLNLAVPANAAGFTPSSEYEYNREVSPEVNLALSVLGINSFLLAGVVSKPEIIKKLLTLGKT